MYRVCAAIMHEPMTIIIQNECLCLCVYYSAILVTAAELQNKVFAVVPQKMTKWAISLWMNWCLHRLLLHERVWPARLLRDGDELEDSIFLAASRALRSSNRHSRK